MEECLLATKQHTINLSPAKERLLILFFIFLLIAVVLLSLCIGRYGLKLSEIWSIISHYLFGTPVDYPSSAETVFIKVRLPRIIASIFVGAALSVAGSTYQGLFRNPMVSPDLLGASSGSGFGAALALLFGAGAVQVQFSAFILGIVAVVFTYAISTAVSRGSNSTLSLVLTGMVVSSLFSAFISIIKYVADPDSKLPEISFWLMGGLSSINLSDLPMLVIPILIGIIPSLLLRYQLNVLSFGEEEAKALGINTKRIRMIFIICSTLITSASVAASGMIGWVGLVIPHLSRMIVGPNYKTLLPISMLIGAIYMVIIDNLARCLFALEIPLGILTSLIGAPFFIYLLLRGRKSWI